MTFGKVQIASSPILTDETKLRPFCRRGDWQRDRNSSLRAPTWGGGGLDSCSIRRILHFFDLVAFDDEEVCVSLRRAQVPTERFQQTSAEPLARSVRRTMRAGEPGFGSRLPGRTSALSRSLSSSRATSSGKRSFSSLASLTMRSGRTPNQALQPTRMLVTFRAYARPAPSTRVADL